MNGDGRAPPYAGWPRRAHGRPPPGDEANWTQVVGLLDQLVAITNEMNEAASSGAGEAEMQEIIDRGTPISDQLDQLANQYGFEACGSS